MNEIVAYDPEQHNEVVARNQALLDLRSRIFRQGLHYGEPFKGSGKPTLLKPGAELILARFKLWPEFIDRGVTERWDSEPPIFHYRYECRLRHRVTNEVWGAGIGSCNSLEDKYRWRKQDRLCPNCGAPKIIRSKYPDKRTGEFGWYCLSCKTPFPPGHEAIEDQPVGRVPNDEIFTLINTLDKMAQKRALVAAVLVATGASTFFTQDVEDFPGYAGEIIDGEFASPDDDPAPTPPPASKPAARKPAPSTGQKPDTPAPGTVRDRGTSADPPESRDAKRETPPAAQEQLFVTIGDLWSDLSGNLLNMTIRDLPPGVNIGAIVYPKIGDLGYENAEHMKRALGVQSSKDFRNSDDDEPGSATLADLLGAIINNSPKYAVADATQRKSS